MIVVRPMRVRDLIQVMAVNRRCFASPWSEKVFRTELMDNPFSTWLVLEQHKPIPPTARLKNLLLPNRNRPATVRQIIGFGGFWLMRGEAHISNIGVDPAYQRGGLGELLMITMLQQAIAREASWTSLEVRVSNTSAIKLYEKYRYETTRLKSSYYRDNGEDAYWMVAKPLDQSYRTMLITYREQLRQKIEWTTEFPQEIGS